jgi:hypothetical protein
MRERKLRRSESFLGIHFDFHAGFDCKEVGKGVTPSMIEAIVTAVDPDYIQCDCKGHPGIASYPTKVGTPVPGFEKDQLRIWRDVTEKARVGLYMHYSGVWDTAVVRTRPEWAAVNADGTRDEKNTSLFSPYVDEVLIPQLKELIDEYGVDGVWIDGDCWATKQDYSPAAIAEFRKRYGIEEIPRAPGEKGYLEYTEFSRQAFRDYVEHYVTELHRHAPHFQVASNWAYSSQMPEPAAIDVDFISGDYSLQDSVNSARFEGRCMQRQGKPWDLMAWAFSCRFAERINCTKSIPQLQQEAAVVLAQGGGFQAYFKQQRDGSIFPWEMELMASVGKFARERQAFCHRGDPVPQVALLYSTKAFYRKNQKVYGGGWQNENLLGLRGTLHALLEEQQVVEVCMEHHLEGRMAEYGLIVVPEWSYLEDAFKAELLAYAKSGGSLLLIGPGPSALFAGDLGVGLGPEEHGEARRWLEYDGWFAGFRGHYRDLTVDADTEVVARHYDRNEADDATAAPAGIVKPFGKGQVGIIPFEFGAQYLRGSTPTLRKFIGAMARRLFPEPLVEVSGSQYVDVTASHKDGRLLVHLVNSAGPHSDQDVYVYDEIPRVGPLTVRVRIPEEPSKVTIEPGGRKPEFVYSPGTLEVTLPLLAIYDIVAIEY